MQTQYNDPKGAIGATKVPLGLIPPHAMEQTAWVHKLGADKYGPWNWRKTGVCASTYVNAILRHLNAWRDGEDLDPESGISHLAHIACSCNILMDAEYCGKLQDDRNTTLPHTAPAEDETEEGSPKVAASYEDFWGPPDEEEEDSLAEFVEDMWRELDKEIVCGWAELGYRILKEGEILRDGDEVYVGFGDWMTLYIPDWIEQKVNDGTYRRKLITDCDLKDEVADCDLKDRQSCPECDALAAYGFNDGPCDYHKNKTCDSKSQSQEECECGRRYVYHFMFGWICEDCELYSDKKDYYP
jgi:hypothetical protein